MEKVIKWYGKYRGIKFEISNWFMGRRECWAYYLIIGIKQLPSSKIFNLTPSRVEGIRGVHFNYEESFWACLSWHGGLTFYEKKWDEEGKLEGFKVGCDYQHYFDEKHRYFLESLEEDAKRSIDTLFTHIPNIKVWCLQDGSYHFPNKCPHNLDREELGKI